jgi:hypothetical protein
MAFDLGDLLQQYLGGTNAPSADTSTHFDQAAQAAPTNVLQDGLSAMFHSDQTPPFGQMACQMFGNANSSQQAGMLNQLIAGMGPGVLASLLNQGGNASGGGALGGLGGLLGQLTGGGAQTPAAITPAQASQITPDQVQVLANHAQQANPSIIDKMSGFYAEHPTLVKTLGTAALGIALSHMAQRSQA